MMPEVTGMSLFDGLGPQHRARERFLFMTGGAVTRQAQEFLDRPEIQHVSKPMSASTLREAVAAKAGRHG